MLLHTERLPRTYEELKQALDDNQGVRTVRMEELRNMHGAKKLGSRVIPAISKKLKGQGLKHYPGKLPNAQDAVVLIYKRESAAEKIINAVLKPSPRSDDFI